MTTSTEEIKHAAVKSVDGWIFLGKSHADCFWQADNIGVKMSAKAQDQGFITSKGRYVSREEAADIAYQAGQVRFGVGVLMSEDLWSAQSDGQFQYDSVKGYYQ